MSLTTHGDALPPFETYQPYRLTRRFAVWSFVVIAAAAVILATLISHQIRTELDRTAARDNAFFSRALANDVWADARPLLDRATANGGEAIRHTPAFARLDHEVRRFISSTPVLAVRMINRRGIVGYATDPSQIGKTVRDTTEVRAALSGETTTKTRFVKSFTGTGGTVSNRWIMSSDLPAPSMAGNGQADGVIELHADVTGHHAVIRNAAVENIAVLVAALLLVYIVLMALVWSAEQAKRAQHLRNLALAEAKARAEAANQSKSEFLANMSHELRTPLNAIIGFSEIMTNEIMGPLGKPQYKDYAGDINRSGRNLLKIIDRVLELVRAENGTLLLDVGDTNVAYIVHSVRRLLSEQAAAGGVALTAEADEDPLVISTDSGRLREILTGLVSNGIKFTPRDGRVALRAERTADGSGVCISVTDSGIGMQVGDLPKATALFGQVEHVHSRGKGGIGLGLPYSRKLTEILAGRFEIKTARNRGTTVTITLPWRFGPSAAGGDGSPQLPSAAQ